MYEKEFKTNEMRKIAFLKEEIRNKKENERNKIIFEKKLEVKINNPILFNK